jgi:hypothetical protein
VWIVCVLQCSSCLLEQGLLRPGIRSPAYRILSRASYLQSILTQEASPVPTGAQYQTSYLPNIPHHTNKEKRVSVKTGGGDFGSYWRCRSQRPSDELLQLEPKTTPSMRRTFLSKGKVHKSRYLSGSDRWMFWLAGRNVPSHILSTSDPTWTSLGSNPSISVSVSTTFITFLHRWEEKWLQKVYFLIICHIQLNDKVNWERRERKRAWHNIHVFLEGLTKTTKNLSMGAFWAKIWTSNFTNGKAGVLPTRSRSWVGGVTCVTEQSRS